MVDIYVRDLDEVTYVKLRLIKQQMRCTTWRDLFEKLISMLESSRVTDR